jgi:hypothetical protein
MPDTNETYPTRLDADNPPESSRWLALAAILFGIKFLLLVPHLVVLWFVNLAAIIVAIVGYFIVLFTGKYPRGMWEFVLGALRRQVRLNAWQLGLVDRYPPFTTR